MVDGVSVGQPFAYKDNNNNSRKAQGLVTITEDKTAKSAMLVAAITDTPIVYAFDKADVTAGDKQVTGTVTPVLTTVHLSVVSGELTADALLGGEIGQAPSDDTGAWSCDVHLDENSTVYAWFTPELSYSDATSARVSIKKEPVNPDPGTPDPDPNPDPKPEPEPDTPRAYTITVDFEAEAEVTGSGAISYMDVQLSGPPDLANVELYVYDGGTYRQPSDPISVSTDGILHAENIYPATQFRIKAGTDVANSSLSVNVLEYKAECLSGDALITLADRTERRLDELTGTEMVLGGDMRPARILRLARGLWSDRHTLYHFDDETVIDETHEHRFFNVEQGFWQKLKNWRVGDHAKRLDGGAPALVSVEPKEERAEMFGIWVERGSYWANGLLSGDASANRPLLADATVEQAIDMAESLTEKDLMRILGGGVPL